VISHRGICAAVALMLACVRRYPVGELFIDLISSGGALCNQYKRWRRYSQIRLALSDVAQRHIFWMILIKLLLKTVDSIMRKQGMHIQRHSFTEGHCSGVPAKENSIQVILN